MKKDASFHMVLRSRVKKQLKSIAALPEEILFNILLLLPADVLYAVMSPEFDARFLLVGERDIKISDIKCQFPGRVLSSCNGLTLVRDIRFCTTRLYYIANPITNRMMTLPTFPSVPILMCSLAFAASSNTHKVVLRTIENMDNPPSYYGCAILTVSVDKAWRYIKCADILHDDISFLGLVMGKGFLYWGSRDFSISVWMLKDHETGDWVKIPDFNVEVTVREAAKFVSAEHLRSLNDCFIPLCWLDEEKLLFSFIEGSNIYFFYDIKTYATRIFEMERHTRIFNHLNSLTWL
ncbi:hypothetical protein LIER_19736 [Lithospermum erythrorhizon]|uniref:F-box associated beta-propeller type 3 domain-containing protein n=1 Tax=Lithospermum erythrorhizon TaxID=34254 RepID=A0AAV3QML6_LITER